MRTITPLRGLVLLSHANPRRALLASKNVHARRQDHRLFQRADPDGDTRFLVIAHPVNDIARRADTVLGACAAAGNSLTVLKVAGTDEE